MPWTITYVIRKRQQVASFMELPKEKRPPDLMIWWGNTEEIESWLDRVYGKRPKREEQVTFIISDDDIG